MFTGIITKTADILETSKTDNSLVIKIKKPENFSVKIGDSVAIDGTCLTVSNIENDILTFSLMSETLSKTTFGIKVLNKVNLELPVTVGNKLDGHIIQGHVDTVGKILEINKNEYKISFPKEYMHLIIEKGSIAIDGVSLTSHHVTNESFIVSLIPHTIENTTLKYKTVNDAVNIEFDIVGKYIARFKETNYEPKQQ